MKTILTFRQTINTNNLVRALRSGKYRQVHCQFKDGKGGFCVLGLGIHLVEPKGTFYLHDFVRDYGFKSVYESNLFRDTSLMTLNDIGKSFTEIADLIEQTYNTNRFLAFVLSPLVFLNYKFIKYIL